MSRIRTLTSLPVQGRTKGSFDEAVWAEWLQKVLTFIQVSDLKPLEVKKAAILSCTAIVKKPCVCFWAGGLGPVWRQLQPVVPPSVRGRYGGDGREGGLHLRQVYAERWTLGEVKQPEGWLTSRRSVCRSHRSGCVTDPVLPSLPRPSHTFVTTVLSPLWLAVQNSNV